MTTEQRKRLNRLSFECTLWLPEDISRELNKVLQHDHHAQNRFELLLKVRTLLSGPHTLTVKDVTHWDAKKELPNDGLPPEFVHGQLKVQDIWQEDHKGEVVPITPTMLENVFVPTQGSKVFFEVQYTGKRVTIGTSDIESLRLQGMRRAGEEILEMTVEFNPKSLADDIARQLMKRLPQHDGVPAIPDA